MRFDPRRTLDDLEDDIDPVEELSESMLITPGKPSQPTYAFSTRLHAVIPDTPPQNHLFLNLRIDLDRAPGADVAAPVVVAEASVDVPHMSLND